VTKLFYPKILTLQEHWQETRRMTQPDLTLSVTRYTNQKLLMAFLLLWPVCLSTASQLDEAKQEIEYRRGREAWMRSEQSPLALAGLFWLKQSSNSFGTDPVNDIVLPAGSAPAKVGRFLLSDGRVRIQITNPSVQAYLIDHKLQSSDLKSRVLKTDAAGGTPDLVRLGDLRMKIIQRGDRLALRLIFLKNPPLLRFSHLNFYEINHSHKVEGKFIPYHPAKKIKVASITGQVEEMECPGVVQFALAGKSLALEPVYETPKAKQLFFMFKDATNGLETYEGGRYLYAGLPQGDRVILNFNQAHNPYCAYNAYSTCEIPPAQNWLKVPIRAGEKKYDSRH
jgi:uncharacterized protein (DUF1684 family)